jgi:CDP-diacylglycerol--glycerol-3-phosphate 3-phosphatidyltransferase
MVPVFGYVLISNQEYVLALFIFWAAGISDLVDGWLARKTNTVSALGQIGDPIADKALTGVAWIGLSRLDVIPWWATLLILVREIGITLWRLTLIKAQVIAADRGGKVKTGIQIAAISIALFNEEFQFQPLDFLLPIFYGVAVIVTLWTGVNYIRSFGGSRA